MVKRDRSRTAQDENRRLLRASPVCHICGQGIDLTLKASGPQADPMAGVIDHVIPLNKGGRDDRSNKRPAHRHCNRLKSDKDHAPIVRRSGSLA